MATIDGFILNGQNLQQTRRNDPFLLAAFILAICFTGSQTIKTYGIEIQALIQTQALLIISKAIKKQHKNYPVRKANKLIPPSPQRQFIGTLFPGIISTTLAIFAKKTSILSNFL